MKTYRLTKKGQAVARNPGRARDGLIDFLYEHKTGTLDELRAVLGAGEAGLKLREYTKLGIVEEVHASDW